MVDEYLSDEQQAEKVRSWLRENGPSMVGTVVVVLAGFFGFNQYRAYQDTQHEEASEVYESLVQAVGQGRNDEAQTLLTRLAGDYGSSPYVDQARLALARLQLDRNDFDAAADYLAEVAASDAEEMQRIASLRLARVRAHQQRFDEALAALGTVDPNSAFAARFAEVRGDIYAAMNQPEDARSEYELAMNSGQPGIIDRAFVQAKMDALPAQAAQSPVGDEGSDADAASD